MFQARTSSSSSAPPRPSAAPGRGSWFHQHFSAGKEPLRVINYWAGPSAGAALGRGGADEEDEVRAWNIYGIDEGGATIHYHLEDPYIRDYYKQRLKEEGVEFQMPDSLFEKSDTPQHYRLS